MRVLHYDGTRYVDVTSLFPAPDPATQTIYATVTSLSPFVIAKAIDLTPSTIDSGTAGPSLIWPPNKQQVPVTIMVSAFHSSGVTSKKIVSVTRNEAGSNQWKVTGDLTLNLQADRSGTGAGRVYTVTVECRDIFGNAARKSTKMMVPHDKGK